jgi:hypothetical protein
MMVEHRCDNCRYFKKDSIERMRADRVWGDCMKLKEHSGDAQDTETREFFLWGENHCKDFEP